MACYKANSLPSGVTTEGHTSYATEADCLQACKEGACCEGTTCTVKPQCQCRCASNSCCGPDTMTVNGITGPRCRGGTKSECDSRGGTWRPCIGCLADANLPDESICRSTDSPSPSQPVEPTFKGVGTVCDPNPCCSCANFGQSPCSGFGIPAQYKATISGLPSHLALANGVWTMNLDTSLSWLSQDHKQATRQYEPANQPASYTIRLGISCDSTSGALRYFYTLSVSAGTGGAIATPAGGTSGGNYYLDGAMSCQGQTLGTAFTATVECIGNALP